MCTTQAVKGPEDVLKQMQSKACQQQGNMSSAIKACENTFTQNLQVIARFGRDIGQRKTRIVDRKSRIVNVLLVETRINLEAKAVERVRKFWREKKEPTCTTS